MSLNNIVYCTGFILWVFVCCFFPRKKYSYLELCPKRSHTSNETSKNVFTLATCNVLLANETFSRWNNNGNPMARSKLIGMYCIFVCDNQWIILLIFNSGKRLLQQTPYFLQNFLLSNLSKKDTVTNSLPDVDILCIQEVWERYWAATMIDQLGSKYSYFIHGTIFTVKNNHRSRVQG
jgi:hypothetical protein